MNNQNKMKLKQFLMETLGGVLMTAILFIAFLLMLNLRAYAATGDTLEEARVVEDVPHEYTTIFATATDEDYEALERVVYWESAVADCKYEVNKAVVETVCNRVLDPKWPSTIHEVCQQKHQFVCKAIPKNVSEYTMEAISDAIAETVNGGRMVLPSTEYVYFSRYKQKYGTDYIWLGDVKADGTPKKGKGMWFGRAK